MGTWINPLVCKFCYQRNCSKLEETEYDYKSQLRNIN